MTIWPVPAALLNNCTMKYFFICLLSLNLIVLQAQTDQMAGRSGLNRLAQTPPMGWNSYDCFGSMVTEAEVRANAAYMAEHLKKYGYDYIVVDFLWSYPFQPEAKIGNYPQLKLSNDEGYTPWLAMDKYGRLLPDPWRFPSSAGGRGFRPLAEYVHSLGLKFGIHVMRGIPRQAVWARSPVKGTANIDASMIADTTSVCRWLNQMWGVDMTQPGAQDYYNSLCDLYASWDVDFIKVDDMSSPFHGPEIEAVHSAIEQCARPMVYSLSPGRTPLEEADDVRAMANMWRISGDFWDSWPKLLDQFELCKDWAPYISPGHWPDADMLPVGELSKRGPVGREKSTGFTPEEQYTMISLWSMFRSPLMIGGDLTGFDDFTLALLTNDEVLAIDQNSVSNHEVYSREGIIVWQAEIPDSTVNYLAVFNTTDADMDKVVVKWSDTGLTAHKYEVRDLWAKSDLGSFRNSITLEVPKHGVKLLKLE